MAIAATAFLVQLVVGGVLDWLGLGPRGQFTLWFVVPLVISVHFVYIGFVHLVERRPATELSGRGAVRETAPGSPWVPVCRRPAWLPSRLSDSSR